MRRDSRRRELRHRRNVAYLTSEDVPGEERGAWMLFLFAHACAYLLLFAAEATWAMVTGVRVWRQRDIGLAASARKGVHKPTLAVLLAARLAYLILRRAGHAKLSRRADDHAREHGDTA